jgi:hypothetical protein
VNVARQYLNKPVKLLKHSRNWLRMDDGSDEYLQRLAQSYIARPLYPIIVTPELEVVDGNLRTEAVMRFGPSGGDTEVQVCITDEALSASALLEIQMESAALTKGLSDYEQYVGCSEWLSLNPGATAKDLSARIHRDVATLSRLLSLSKCVDAVRDAAAQGKISYSKWWQISKAPAEDQAALLAGHLRGATRGELERESRKRRNGDGKPAVRLSRITIPLATEPATGTVTLTGQGMIGLDEAESLLKEAMKAVRSARDKSWDTKTAQAVWRDAAKAGEDQAKSGDQRCSS